MIVSRMLLRLSGVVLFFTCSALCAATVNDFPKARIAVVGGTFLNDALLKRKDLIKGSFRIKTKIGESPTIYACESGGIPFYYVHGHGEGKWVETWAALYDLNVRDALGGATAGGINPSMKLYDYVVPDDFIDMNVDRPLAMPIIVYRDPNAIPLPRYTPAMDPLLRQIMIEETRKALRASHNYDDIQVHEQGVVIQARGGRFETAAEIRMFASWGADLVTMNVGTEMAYARMMGINYASLVAISNPAEGVGKWDWETLKDVYPRLNPLSLSIVLAAIPRIAAIGDDVPRVGDGLRMHPEMTSEPGKSE
jgi:5'-methylthioadenosine phosphorylase